MTLLTDFGTDDVFVASMKGVVLSICPGARLVDVTHAIPPQDVRRGALALLSAVPWFPPGTVHLAVVDPGVGTERAPIVVAAGGAFLVGPDNGLLGPAARRLGARWPDPRCAHVVARGSAPAPSATFHGRDVFAPAAARLAAGARPSTLGGHPPAVVDLALPEARREGARVLGEVAFVDHFGNLVSNIPAAMIPPAREDCVVRVGGRAVRGIRRTYGDGAAGRPMALVESTGHLEIAVPGGSAAALLGAASGSPVVLEARPGRPPARARRC